MLASSPEYFVEVPPEDSYEGDTEYSDEGDAGIATEEVDESEAAEFEDSTALVDSSQTPQNDDSAEAGFVMFQTYIL